MKFQESHIEGFGLSVLNSYIPSDTFKEIDQNDVNNLEKYLGHETHLNMTNFIIRKQCEMEDLIKIQNNIN